MTEEQFMNGEAFMKEFKALVRKYVPEYPTDEADIEFLYHIQDKTSCFNPFIWSDDENAIS